MATAVAVIVAAAVVVVVMRLTGKLVCCIILVVLILLSCNLRSQQNSRSISGSTNNYIWQADERERTEVVLPPAPKQILEGPQRAVANTHSQQIEKPALQQVKLTSSMAATVTTRLTTTQLAKKINDAEMTKIQKRRNNIVEKICRKYNISRVVQANTLDHLIVDDDHKLIYCYVPKVACTNWKRVMLVLSGILGKNVTDPLQIAADQSHIKDRLPNLSLFTKEEVESRLKEYTKFMFVRHPFERLLSAFRNKFEKPFSDYFLIRYGRNIIKRYRKNPPKASLQKGSGVTFSEFMHYLADAKAIAADGSNEHWVQYNTLCNPCTIHFDIIGKYETLNDDANFVLKSAKVNELVQFPSRRMRTRTVDLVQQYMDGIPPSDVKSLLRAYRLDFEMFEYTWPKRS